RVGNLYVARHEARYAGRRARDEKQIGIQAVFLVQTPVLGNVPDRIAALQGAVRKSDFFLRRCRACKNAEKNSDKRPEQNSPKNFHQPSAKRRESLDWI